MYRKIIVAATCCLLQVYAFLFSETASSMHTSDTGVAVQLEATQGYRHDKLQWSNSGKNKKPNILSELTYKDIKIYQTRLVTKMTLAEYFAKVNLGYGAIFGGHVRDSSYFDDNKKQEFSRATAPIRGSYVLDAQVSFGKDIELAPNMTISPLFGYMWEYEKLHSKHGKRNFGGRRHTKISSSTYRARWDAPFIGVRFGFDATEKLSLYSEYDLLFAVGYHGSAHTDRGGLHFRQHSNRWKGFGNVGLVGASYELCKNLTLKGEYQISWLQARDGTETRNIHHHKMNQPFHKATLLSNEARLCLEYAF